MAHSAYKETSFDCWWADCISDNDNNKEKQENKSDGKITRNVLFSETRHFSLYAGDDVGSNNSSSPHSEKMTWYIASVITLIWRCGSMSKIGLECKVIVWRAQGCITQMMYFQHVIPPLHDPCTFRKHIYDVWTCRCEKFISVLIFHKRNNFISLYYEIQWNIFIINDNDHFL